MSKKRRSSDRRQRHEGRRQKESPKTSRRDPRRQGQSSGLPLKAVVDKNRKGFAFLIFENKSLEDAFVPPREAARLFHGDRVSVELRQGRVQSLRVLEHRFREVVGRFTPHSKPNIAGGGWVVYERKKAREEVYIPKSSIRAQSQDWVRVSLQFHEKGPHPVTGEILAVYGQDLPASADIEMVAAEFNISEEHTVGAEREASSIPDRISEADFRGRKDLRQIPFITIDGETARDFDDAVYVERQKSGYILWVAIADVSHYVKEGSELDKSARSKGTSVYFPERAFHMLPRALSERLCSLRPKEDRLALVARMEFDHKAKIRSTQVMEAVIESKRRATYNEIQNEWKAHEKDSTWEFAPHFELYFLLRKMRSDRGSIDFELPEAEVVVSPDGEVLSIEDRPRLDSHRLIEEFMIAANENVTEWMMKRKWPFVYRVHDEPSEQALEKFKSLAATVGVRVNLERGTSPKVMADLVKKLEGHPAQSLLNIALLRSMKQAIYSATHGGHYGLASQAYTHFTSPIRRYPDLVVHRLIRAALTTKLQSRQKLETALEEICEHCSYRERVAAEADREAIKLKQVRLMLKHLGEEFPSTVVGITASGLFVQLRNPFVEGLVSVESMMDDAYEFNEDRMVLYGRRKRKTFKIGDAVQVKVVRADVERRLIDFNRVG